jgi:anti-sigma factor RsiW
MTALIAAIAAVALAELGTVCAYLADDARADADIARIEGMLVELRAETPPVVHAPDPEPAGPNVVEPSDTNPYPDPVPWETIGERAMCSHFPRSITAEWQIMSSHIGHPQVDANG